MSSYPALSFSFVNAGLNLCYTAPFTGSVTVADVGKERDEAGSEGDRTHRRMLRDPRGVIRQDLTVVFTCGARDTS